MGGRDLLDPERDESSAVMGQSETLADTFREKVTRFFDEDTFRRSFGSTGASLKDGVNVLVDSSVT